MTSAIGPQNRIQHVYDFAALDRVGPTDPVHGYPQWYQDKTSLFLDFCSPLTQSELDGGWCLLLPPIPPSAPEVFPDVFSDEHFYWAGGATFDVFGDPQNAAILTLGVEAAFASGPVIWAPMPIFTTSSFFAHPAATKKAAMTITARPTTTLLMGNLPLSRERKFIYHRGTETQRKQWNVENLCFTKQMNPCFCLFSYFSTPCLCG